MAKAKEVTVEIPAIKTMTMLVKIVGDTPLICHAFSQKAKTQMLDKQQLKAKQGRKAKDPERDFLDGLHSMDKKPIADAKHIPPCGFPARGFKAAMVRAAQDAGLKMVDARRFFHVIGDLVEIKGAKWFMREDTVKIGQGTTDLRYRPETTEWWAELTIKYNVGVVSKEQIVNLINLAGFGVGVGEMRPCGKQSSGCNGMFHVELNGQIKKGKK